MAVTHQYLVEIDTLSFGSIEQAPTDGRSDVGISGVHPMLSRRGLIMPTTRQTLAKFQSAEDTLDMRVSEHGWRKFRLFVDCNRWTKFSNATKYWIWASRP